MFDVGSTRVNIDDLNCRNLKWLICLKSEFWRNFWNFKIWQKKSLLNQFFATGQQRCLKTPDSYNRNASLVEVLRPSKHQRSLFSTSFLKSSKLIAKRYKFGSAISEISFHQLIKCLYELAIVCEGQILIMQTSQQILKVWLFLRSILFYLENVIAVKYRWPSIFPYSFLSFQETAKLYLNFIPNIAWFLSIF